MLAPGQHDGVARLVLHPGALETFCQDCADNAPEEITMGENLTPAREAFPSLFDHIRPLYKATRASDPLDLPGRAP